MGAGGFEPPKAEPTGLQPVPFGRSGTPPGDGHCSPPLRALAHYDLGVIFPELRRPGLLLAGVAAWVGILLALDIWATRREQMLLGAATWILLAAAIAFFARGYGARVLVVVAVATCFEVLGSIIWGVYRYRHGNLPMFIPPGHGLVYLSGVAISQLAFVRRNLRPFTWVVCAFAAGWAIVGLTGVLGRIDAIGAFGVCVFLGFVAYGRGREVLCGVFLFVAALEIYGTALGTWTWAEIVPGLGLPDGNPPAGAASGYTLFDLAAFALAAPLALWLRRLGALWPGASRRPLPAAE